MKGTRQNLKKTEGLSVEQIRKQLQTKPLQIVTTIHKDVTERLAQVNPSLAAETRKVLDINKSERHIRGGMATKEKYLHQHV
ncbi:sporulation transcriptional regulator SpoIIID [Roseburia hominis]|uniref:sporulation transcriptional regulator SpoIIID n=1 Tax=Roseburia hominis TaxID=301301 RepID=UPI002F4108BC